MSVPKHVRETLRQYVGLVADQLQWDSISNIDKAGYYDQWTEDPRIGGVLERYIDKAQVRVYVKDTLVKYVAQHRLADAARPLRVLRLSESVGIVATHRQPHGRTLADGRVICWGRAEEWRSVLLAIHERTYERKDLRPYGAVLMRAVGRYHDDPYRAMVNDARTRLGIEHLAWLDT